MNIVNIALNFGTFFTTYLIYFYLMNNTSEKKDFKYWNTLNYSYILIFPVLLLTLSIINLYTYFLSFLSLALYAIIFYQSSFKRHAVNVFIFYLIGCLSTYLIQLVFSVIIYAVHIDLTYYVSLLIDILLSASSLSVLFIITKKLIIKLLVDDGNEFTNNQFLILLFPCIVGFISLYLFTIYPDNPEDFYVSSILSILLSLAIVCSVFILVYLANIKVLNAQEKSLSLLREKRRLEESIEIQYNCFQAIQNAQKNSGTIHNDTDK